LISFFISNVSTVLACYKDENSIAETKFTFFKFCFRFKITNMCNCYTMPELLFVLIWSLSVAVLLIILNF